MLHASPLRLLLKRKKIIMLAGIIVAIIAGIITALFPLQYRADAQVLIISQSRYGVDPYTVIRSAERVGENISQVMKTSDFYNKVRELGQAGIDWSQFEGLNDRDKRKKWEKTIEPSVVYGTGVLNVSAYSVDSAEAQALAAAAANTLVSKGWEYVGGDVTIKIVNQPIVTRYPVRPNILINVVLGFIVGILLTSLMVVRKR